MNKKQGITSEGAKDIRKWINKISDKPNEVNNLDNDYTVIVCHRVGTSDEKGPNGIPWIKYWNKHVDDKFRNINQCPECKREKTNFVGAHVRSDNGDYICPVCNDCNSKYQTSNSEEAEKKPFEVKRGYLCPLPKESKRRQSN